MKELVLAAFVATAGLAVVPASAMPAASGLSRDNGLVQTIEDGCPRNYYRYYGRCAPNSRGHRGYGYGYEYYDRPRYYSAPRYYDTPNYYVQRRHYYSQPYYGSPNYYGGDEY